MAQTISQLYAAKAGAGKPVSASKVSGGTESSDSNKKKTISDLYREKAAGTYYRAAGTKSSAAEATKPKTISELYRTQAAQGYSRPASAPAYTPAASYTQPEDPMDAALRRQKEIAEQYARTEREYKAAQADMQMMAMSGGMVSADAAAREQAAREAYLQAQKAYTQSQEKAPSERQSWQEAARQQREAQAELELAAMGGGYAGADVAQRAAQAQQEREKARQAYLTQRNQMIAQGDGTNAARGTEGPMGDVYALADNRVSSLPGSEYAALMDREDFGKLSQPGESKLSWNPFKNDVLYNYINDINGERQRYDAETMASGGKNYAKYALMTDQEIAVYNYLYASGGKKAADAFLKDLEPELDKQWYSGASRTVTDWAEKDEATKAIASAATVAGKPVRDLTSVLATLGDVGKTISREGINPYSEMRTASRLTQDIRGAVSQDMGDVGRFAYNTAMSAADSAVGSFMASGIGQSLGLSGDKLTNVTKHLSSALMSSEVASLATAEGKEKGYSDIGALSLGLFRGAMEWASEEIGGEWVIRNLKANPQSFITTMLRNFIPEGAEEVMSDLGNEGVNLLVDWLCGTEESYIGQAYRYFRDKGTAEQKENPWLWTALTVLKQEGLAFLGGGFATIGSTGAQYNNMQQSFRGAAEQLNTDNQTVVQLMEELRTEDPAAVAAMAEISGAESVEDFRAKMRTLDLAAEEADEAARGKKGKKKAPESRSAQDLVKAWMEKHPEGGVPAPFRGMEDAIMKGDQNGKAGEQSNDPASADRYAGNGAAEQSGAAAQLREEGAQPGGQGEVRPGVGESIRQDLQGRDVTPAELGIDGGSTESTVHVLTEEEMTPQAKEARQLAQRRGLKTVFVSGPIGLRNGNAAAVIQGDTIVLSTDAEGEGTDLIAETNHEIWHDGEEADPELTRKGMDVIRRHYSPEEIQGMKDTYRETYANLYDFERMSEDEIVHLMERELCGDAYAGRNAFADNQELRDEMHREFPELEQARSQTAQGAQSQRGPPRATFKGYDQKTGKGIYESNYPEHSPAEPKRRRLIELVQNVWSKKPIDLVIQHEDGTTEVIQAQFDPDYDETGKRKTDLGKLAYGNRQGSKKDKRVTLNLADDYYQILQDSKYITSAENYDEASEINKDVEIWHYFVNELLYKEQGSEEKAPYSMYIDVKKKPAGNYVYTFHAEEEKNNGQTTPQTVNATVNSSNTGTANGLPTDSIRDSAEKSNTENKKTGPKALATFAGKNARTADSQTLSQAEQMERDGSTNEEIRQATGWYRGRDGQWRFEIDDSGAKYHRGGDAQFRKDHPEYARYVELTEKMLSGSITDEEFAELRELAPTWGAEQRRLQDMVNRGNVRLDMILDHEALFEAYPELRDARVVFQKMEEGEKAKYNANTNTITISNELKNAPEDAMIHEIQHAVQRIEGFSGGASEAYWSDKIKRAATDMLTKKQAFWNDPKVQQLMQLDEEVFDEELEKLLARDPDVKKKYDDYRKAEQFRDRLVLSGNPSAFSLYENTAGEIEARDAANRRNLTAEEREKTPPDLGDENTVFAEGAKESYALRDKKIPTREELDAKGNIPVVDIREKTIGSFKEQREAFLGSKEAQTLYEKPLLNRDTNEPLFIIPATITHTFSNAGQENILLAKHLREIAENAVLTHGEPSRSSPRDHSTGVYKFFGAVQTNNGVQPAKLTVKEYNIEGQDLPKAVLDYVENLQEADTYAPIYDGKVLVLEGIEKETSSSAASPSANAKLDNHPSVSTISVKELLDLVKGEDQKYIPQPKKTATTQRGPKALATMKVPVGETVQQEFERLSQEIQEEGHDAEYYQSRGRRLNELMEQGAKPAGSEQEDRIATPPAEARNDKAEDKGSERGPIGEDGIRTVKAEDAAEELMDIGEARVKNDAGTFLLSVRRKSDTNYLARVDHNGKLAASKSFETAEEAAAYAQSWVEGRTQGQEDAELDLEKSEPKEPQNALEQLLDPEAYQKEIARQKKNKAAQAATQTLRERIRRAQSELNALRRLEKSTGLTEAQKKHKADVQETLDIMNDELTSRKGRRQAKKEKAKATGNKPTRSAAEAKNALMDLFHTPAGERSDTGRAIEQKLTEIFESGKLTDKGRQELFDLLMEKGETTKHAERLYEAIRRDLKGTRIYVSEEDRKGYGDNWDDLRRRAWAAGIYLTNNINDKGADVHNLEFSEVYGERTFPTDIAAQDMLENMIELAEKGRPTKQSLREALEEEARQERMDPEEVFGDMWNRMEETLRTYAEKAGLEVDLKNRTASQLADERQRWQERMDKRSQARRESEIRGKLLNGLKRLERARNKTAPEIKAAIEEILQDIDTQARQITPAGLEDLQALQRAYLDARKAAGYENDENMGNWIPNPYVEKRLEALTKKHVNDMDLQEVIELGRTVAGLEHAIATHNQMIGEEWDSTIEAEANGVRAEVNAAKGAKPGFFQKWFMEEHLSPRRFLEMLGGWKDGSMKKLSRSLEDGQTRALDFQRRATQSFDPFLTKKENRKWLEKASGKKAVWEKYTVVDGVNEDGASFTEIELTPMMKISLYLHSRNMDNLRHIQTGGIVIPNKELYKAGKIADAYELGDRVKMNPESVRKIAGELTDVEKTFANHMITVFDTVSKDAINEVSMQLDGFERAGVENYMPIETDRNFIKSDVAGEARAQTVEGIGSIANERIHASNPVMLIDASDVLTRQIDKVSRYYGYAIPIRNFQAVNNYVFHEDGAPFNTSVKELMGKKWGAGAEQYITKMLQDLQSSGRSSDMTSRALSALRGHLAGATLAFNPAVAVSQTASYPGAAQAVGWDGLAAGLIGGKVDTKLIEKYTPLYWYRNQGNSTQELGDVMKEKSMEQKLPWVFNWIQKMDSATIRRLWKAAEYRVSKDTGLKPGSQADIDAGRDAYYKAVAEVFNRAVYDTQPNYTNMERAQILRSDSDVTRFLTMYKTVPLQYYGMMVEASGRLRAAVQSGNKDQIAKAQKYALDTFGGLLAANTVYVAMKAIFKTFRKKDKDYRDEEGNITAESYTRQLGKDLVETYAGSIIGGSEALSVIQSLATGKKWTGPEMSSLSYVEEMVNALGDITDAMGEEDPRKAAKAIKNSAETLAMGFGVPAKNMETYIMATVRRISPRIGMEYDNLFGGIQKSDLKNMDEDAVSMAAGLILSNRTGVSFGQAVNDELARLYGAGETAAVPTSMPDSFTYNGTTVTIKDRKKYGETWGGVVGDNLEELIGSDHYQGASDKDKAKMVNRLYEYATVQARKGADPAYSADGNSTYGWTVKADEAVAAGIPLPETICALNAFAGMTADKDEDGNSISGSKKAKVCGYIDELDLTVEQKDILYLMSGYKENSLPYTPWHGWTEDGSGTSSRKGKSSGKRSGSRSGGGRSRGRSAGKSSGSVTAAVTKAAAKGKTSTTDYGIEMTKALFGGSSAGSGKRSSADATGDLVKIVDRYYNGNVLLALADGGRKIKGRTKVDFKL